MTKGVKILIAAAALLFVGSLVWILLSFRDSDSTIVEVVQNNKVIYTFDLSKEKDRTIRVNAPDGGWNDIKIENGTICISDADCSDHTCVKTGVRARTRATCGTSRTFTPHTPTRRKSGVTRITNTTTCTPTRVFSAIPILQILKTTSRLRIFQKARR